MKKIFKIILAVIVALLIGAGIYGVVVYHDVKNTSDKIYQTKGKVTNKRYVNVSLDDKQPFSVLLMGTDTGDFGRHEKGRTDTMILATVNPEEKQTNMLSIPRDTLVTLPKYGGSKINAAYTYGGIPLAVDTIQKEFDIPVDYYVLINMRGLKQLVNAVDGITVNNKLDFKFGGHHFKKGKIKLNGDEALKYSRMRHDDPRGDFGRQLRQQQVIEAILQKAMSIRMLTKYNSFLKVIGDNMKTNLTLQDMNKIQNNYRSANHFKNNQIESEEQRINNLLFQVISDATFKQTSDELKAQLFIE
ncbi:transcriptional regulator [Companilactobacillus sp. RD055328]|uniref:LCP family glycopolymer transferase n=1 Tax=Companilactobacillus sp. RD055328 TaxID=2916634 RepID=UPI001FC8DF18|nr:LCP family protein [Companilactobacillus sp. RD055328]GKQ43351.1 transcriptional regulator [Companilactobacillus sp. RD055328]